MSQTTSGDDHAQAEDFARFRGDFCLSSPESYSLEEKREICDDMLATRLEEGLCKAA